MSRESATFVECARSAGGWRCSVVVGSGTGATRHEVIVRSETLARLRPGADEPASLVEDAFAFLLEREPRESILRQFDLEVIGRYFPGWERELPGQGR